MKVLAICGSPRRRNGYSTLKTMMEKNPDVDFKILMLGEVDLKNCLGCYSCINLGEDKCPLKDDRDMIIEEIMEADGVIFASPTYARSVSALMKNFIDRTSFYPHRPQFFDKYAMVMATYSGFGADMVIDYMKGNFTQCGFNVVSTLEIQIASQSEKEKKDNYDKTISAFNTLKTAIKENKSHIPTFYQLVYFNILKFISEWNKEAGKADYKFYKERKDYYIDVKINPLKLKLAKWIAGKEIAKMKKNA